MSAATSSTGTSSLSGGWLTVAQENAVVGYPAQETYPGPVTEDHNAAGPPDPGRDGPPEGVTPASPYDGLGHVYPDLSGGQIPDTVAELGNSAPMAAFDSNAGPAFAPAGPIAPTHGYDTGGTERKEHVPVPRSPGWWRRTLTGQTWNRQAQVTTAEGWAVSAPNDRLDLDQAQGQNAGGYDPAVIPYSERPILANFAAEAHPVDAVGSVYGVQGSLPDMSGLGGQGSFVYTSPPDPYATVQAPAAAAPAYQPALGMEYVSG